MRDAFDVKPDIGAERRTHPADARIAALAARQHGVVARTQLVALGLGRRAIGHRIEHGRLHPIHRGVYAVGHRLLTREGAWLAAGLAVQGVLSHRSAAALWGIRDTRQRSVEVTAPAAVRQRPGLQIRRALLAEDEITTCRGIPVTTPARTLLDLAADLDEHQLARAAHEAEVRRLTSPTSLADLASRYPRRPGVPAIRRLLRTQTLGDTMTRSALEDRFLALLDAERLPKPRTNRIIEVPDHPPIEADFAWPEHRLTAELDGFATHATRHGFERDRVRDRDRGLQAAGWRVLRITPRQLDADASAIGRQLRALTTRQTRSTLDPTP